MGVIDVATEPVQDSIERDIESSGSLNGRVVQEEARNDSRKKCIQKSALQALAVFSLVSFGTGLVFVVSYKDSRLEIGKWLIGVGAFIMLMYACSDRLGCKCSQRDN
jgi:hypothetical protein